MTLRSRLCVTTLVLIGMFQGCQSAPQSAAPEPNRLVDAHGVTESWTLAPRDAVVLDPNRILFQVSSCAMGSHTDHAWTDHVATGPAPGHPRFTMAWPGRRHVWSGGSLIPIDPNTYPILVATYRATDTTTPRFWDAHVTLITDTGLESKYRFVRFDNPATGTPLIADGRIREMRIDTRDVRVAPDQDVYASKPFTSMWIGTRAGSTAPATFELLGLRLESTEETRPAEPFADDTPLRLRVSDPHGQPVAGARVTVDAQRINSARTGQSDVLGEVTVTPLANPAGQHTVRVEKDGWMPTEFSHLPPGPDGTVSLVIEKAVTYRGRIVDERGAGIPHVSVRMYPAGPSGTTPDAGKTVTRTAVATGPDGRWASPPMPAGVTQLCLRFTHPDYVSDTTAEIKPGHDPQQMIRGYPVATLRDGIRVYGQMLPAPGNELRSVKTQIETQGYTGRRISWEEGDGRFDLGTIAPCTARLTLEAAGHQNVVITLDENHDGSPLHVQLTE